jgi:uncharacterized protein (DUF1800 family)
MSLSPTALAIALSLLTGVIAVAAPPRKTTRPPTSSPRPAPPRPKAPAPIPLTEEQKIIHVLNRIGFGPRPGDVARIKAIGLERYIAQQLAPETVPDSAVDERLARMERLTQSGPALALLEADVRKNGTKMLQRASQRESPRDAPQRLSPEERTVMEETRQLRRAIAQTSQQFVAARLLRAVESERQLQEVLVDFWSNHFNVDMNKVRLAKVEDEREVIRKHALGKFRDLLGASAHSPAMLVYLDNFQSIAPGSLLPRGRRIAPEAPLPESLADTRKAAEKGDPAARLALSRLARITAGSGESDDEAYARLRQTMADASKRGINENYARELMELHTLGVDGGYTQADVQEVARCFTGWGIDGPGGGRYGGTFAFHARLHDDGAKTVLGQRFLAGGGATDGEKVLDLLAAHPSTMRFISTKLCRRLVSDTPPKSLVDQCVATWQRTEGDIREIVRTIVSSPEFTDRSVVLSKIKSPFEYAVSAARALGATVRVGDDGSAPRRPSLGKNASGASPRTLGQHVAAMGQPLYQYAFPTGYPEDSRKWVNSGALIARLNYALALVGGRVDDLTLAALPGGEDPQTLAAALNIALSPSTRATLLRQANQDAATEPDAARRRIALVLGSPEFQRR